MSGNERQAGGRLAGKVALVTGGGRGIGREICLAYAAEGAAVAVLANQSEEVSIVAADCAATGAQSMPIACDVREEDAVRSAVSSLLRRFDRIDVLVNAAGMDLTDLGLEERLVESLTLDDWRRVFAVNVEGTFLFAREVIPVMRRGDRGGSIINFSSGTVRRPPPGYSAYTSSKHAVEGFTQILALEVADAGIRANCLQPGGLTDTAIVPSWMRPSDRADLHQPSVVRECAVYLASDKSTAVSGESLVASEWNWQRGLRVCSCRRCTAAAENLTEAML
jgi:NAD(P)-dependent dehydrogenase (short-subunit alcohol dehydrogenase family)